MYIQTINSNKETPQLINKELSAYKVFASSSMIFEPQKSKEIGLGIRLNQKVIEEIVKKNKNINRHISFIPSKHYDGLQSPSPKTLFSFSERDELKVVLTNNKNKDIYIPQGGELGYIFLEESFSDHFLKEAVS